MDFEKFKTLHLKFNSDSEETVYWNTTGYNEYIDAMHGNTKFHEWVLKEKFSRHNFETDSFCCLTMADNIFESLDEKGEIKYDDHDVIMNKWDDGTYGIPIHDGGSSVIEIRFCPWCGQNLIEK